MFRQSAQWLAHRFGWHPIRAALLDRRVPKTPWYYGDGATLMTLLGVLVVTGAVMGMTYSPHADAAYASVEHLTFRQPLGWFVRGLHYWSAGLMVVMLFFHLFRLILVASYKAPREGTWLIGTVLFGLVYIMSYTGYILRWDERAVYGLKVPLFMFERIPLIGESLVLLVQGGPEIGATTLTRMYAVHVLIIPMLLLLPLTAFHLYLVVLRGVTSPAEQSIPVKTAEEQERLYHAEADDPKSGETFHPYTSAKSMAMAMVVFALAVGLTIVVGPAPLLREGTLTEASQPAEEWWFWWFSGLIALLPGSIAPYMMLLFPLLVFLGLLALPFVDRSPYRGMKSRPMWVAVVILAALTILLLSDYRRRSPFTAWPEPEVPPLPAGVAVANTPEAVNAKLVISEETNRGRVLFARYGCTSCHPVAGHGRQVGPDIARLDEQRPWSREEIRHVTREGVYRDGALVMPAYASRLSDDALERIVEFCHVAQTFPRER